MSKKIWTTEETCKLIEKYRNEINLWNPKDSDYKNRLKKIESLKKLGNDFNVTISEIDRKLKNINSQYRRERRNYRKFKKSGATWNFHAKWFGYNLMNFLHNKEVRKELQTQDTEVSDSPESSDNEATQESLIEIKYEELSQDLDEEGDDLRETKEQYNEQLADDHSTSQNHYITPVKNKNTTVTTEMVNVMNNICKQREQKPEVDEYDLYGELVARKLKKLSTNYARSTVQYMINDILYHAEIGYYDVPSRSVNENLPHQINVPYHDSRNPPSVSGITYSNPPSVVTHATHNLNVKDPLQF